MLLALQICSAFFIALIAYPTYKELILKLGKRRGWGVIILLGIFALCFEYFALQTGWPYGGFTYGQLIGPKVAGILPLPVFYAWAPMVIGVCTLGARISRRFPVVMALFLLILVDVVVDPGAVAVGMWKYVPAGSFYGVPLSNFAGWVVSGLVGISITYLVIKPSKLRELEGEKSLRIIVGMWTLVGIFYGMWIPVVLGGGLLYILGHLRLGRIVSAK